MDDNNATNVSPFIAFVLHQGGVRKLHISLQSLIADDVLPEWIIVSTRNSDAAIRQVCKRYRVEVSKVNADELGDYLRSKSKGPVSFLNSGDIWMPGRQEAILSWYTGQAEEILLHDYHLAHPDGWRHTLAIIEKATSPGPRAPVSCLTFRGAETVLRCLSSNGNDFPSVISISGFDSVNISQPLAAIAKEGCTQRFRRFAGLKHRTREAVGRPLADFAGKHQGERAFIIGNGPSLNVTNLGCLQDELTFCSNGFFALFDRLAWRPSYYTCIDTVVLPSLLSELESTIRDLPNTHFFLPLLLEDDDLFATYWWMPSRIQPLRNISFFEQRESRAKTYSGLGYLKDYLIRPATVTLTLLQLAVLMGCSPIYLIGCDHTYSIPENATRKEAARKGGVPRLSLDSDTDVNHFLPSYFGKGKPWHEPNTEKMTRDYEGFKSRIDPHGSRIFNATVGGRLEVFPRVDFNSLF